MSAKACVVPSKDSVVGRICLEADMVWAGFSSSGVVVLKIFVHLLLEAALSSCSLGLSSIAAGFTQVANRELAK